MRVTRFGTEVYQATALYLGQRTWNMQISLQYGTFAIASPPYWAPKTMVVLVQSRSPTGYEAIGKFQPGPSGYTTALSNMLTTAQMGTADMLLTYPGNTAILAEWFWDGVSKGTWQLVGNESDGKILVSGVANASDSIWLDNTTAECSTGDLYSDWDVTADLNDWTGSVGLVSGGRIYGASTGPSVWGIGLEKSEIAIAYAGGCVLIPPSGRPWWIYRTRSSGITEAAGKLYGQANPLEAAQTNILTGSSYGLCHAWMTDQGHRALVYEHSGNLSAALWDGDWQPMLVQAARTKPWAIRLEPSNDVWIPCIDGSNNLKLDRLVWDGAVSTYSVSTTELDTGIDAKDVGGMWIEPNGEVGLAYVNMSDQLAIATGDLSGGSWTL